jgi:hypothetical protein
MKLLLLNYRLGCCVSRIDPYGALLRDSQQNTDDVHHEYQSMQTISDKHVRQLNELLAQQRQQIQLLTNARDNAEQRCSMVNIAR